MAGKLERLGEILRRRGLLSGEMLEQALRAQEVLGGRLGTNVVDLGMVHIDDVTRCLSRQLGVPPALQRDFRRADSAALEAVPAELCARYSVFPLRLQGKLLSLAMRDPLQLDVVDEIAFSLGLMVRAHVAAELRLAYYLEQVYLVGRDSRFLAYREEQDEEEEPEEALAAELARGVTPAAPEAVDAGAAGPADEDAAVLSFLPETEAVDESLDESLDQAVVAAAQPPPEPPPPRPVSSPGSGVRVRRPSGPVRPSAPAEPPPTAAGDAPQETPSPAGADAAPAEPPGAVRRRRPSSGFFPAAPTPLHAPRSLRELENRLEQAQSREEVTRLLVQPVVDYAALVVLFLLRQGTACALRAWGSQASKEEVRAMVISLSNPSLLQRAARQRAVVRGPAQSDALQEMITSYLRVAEPGEVCVAPVIMGDRVINLIYVLAKAGAQFDDQAVQRMGRLAATGAEAYANLIRQTKG